MRGRFAQVAGSAFEPNRHSYPLSLSVDLWRGPHPLRQFQSECGPTTLIGMKPGYSCR